MITEILTHVADAKRRLIQQYKGKPIIATLITAFVQEFQNLETVGKDLNEDRSVDTATGTNLDRLGAIVGQPRESGQSDADYRIRIKSKISQNISQGEPERLIEVFKTLKAPTLTILEEHFPAAVAIESDATFADQDEANLIIDILERTAAAAVRVDEVVVFDPTEAFAFAGALSGFGFGTTADPLVGGKLATLWNYKLPFAFAGDNPQNDGFGSIHDPLVGGVFFS